MYVGSRKETAITPNNSLICWENVGGDFTFFRVILMGLYYLLKKNAIKSKTRATEKWKSGVGE